MCLFNRKSYNKINREQIVDAIFNLENDEKEVEKEIESLSKNIKEMVEKGESLGDDFEKIMQIKKIMNDYDRRNRAIKKAMFILYNIRLLYKLKDSVDEHQMINKVRNMDVFGYLNDYKKLAIYLNEILDTKVSTIDILTDADETFLEVENNFFENAKIYGVSDYTEDKLMSMFELNKENGMNPHGKDGEMHNE